MTIITPILLAGGSGTRLWPLSRKSYPKQFSKLLGDKSLFQQSAIRLTSSNGIDFSPHVTLTNSDFRFIVVEQLQEVGIDPGPILIEPTAKNTGPAILAACYFSLELNKDAVLLVAPSDHVIPDEEAFYNVLKLGISQVKIGKIVTFGITPTHPDTGYGYLEYTKELNKDAFDLVQFVEKPERAIAKKMLQSGNYLWNAGIFMFKAKDMVDAFAEHATGQLQPVKEAVKNANPDLGFTRLDPKNWSKALDISIDYSIMEKASNLVVIPFSSNWSDLGDWDSVWKDSDQDHKGVAISNNSHAFDCNNTLLRSESESQQLVGIGLENIIAVAMPDAVLVSHKDKSQDVKNAVNLLKSKDISQAETFPKDHRPWGWFESLALSNRFQVKKIFVNPGGALSLQSHQHRSEHWIVVEGTAKVTVDGKDRLLSEGESIYVPLGAIHRMENTGKVPAVIIEVQTGQYLGEDDITRYEDIYSRD